MARAVEVFKHNAVQLIAHETQLKRLNQRLDIALNNMARGLSMFDAHERLVICNATYLNLYGLPSEMGRPGTRFEDILQRFNDLVSRIAAPDNAEPLMFPPIVARKLIEIEDMTSESCTFSVGVIHGGQWVNCVTTTCTGEALSMAKRQEDLDRGVDVGVHGFTLERSSSSAARGDLPVVSTIASARE